MEEKKTEGGGESKKCCHGHGYGAMKVIGALVLIMLGWICGYLMGQGGFCRRGKGMCSNSMMSSCPMMPASQDEQKSSPK